MYHKDCLHDKDNVFFLNTKHIGNEKKGHVTLEFSSPSDHFETPQVEWRGRALREGRKLPNSRTYCLLLLVLGKHQHLHRQF